VRCLLVKKRRGPVNRHAHLFADGAEIVDRVADNVEHAAQCLFAYWHGDGRAKIDRLHTADHAVSGFHGDRAHATLAKVLLHLYQPSPTALPNTKIHVTQREISQMIGVSRESANKQLQDWQRRKWLKLERGGVVIFSPDALRDLVAAG
jgi:hypothetical protein